MLEYCKMIIWVHVARNKTLQKLWGFYQSNQTKNGLRLNFADNEHDNTQQFYRSFSSLTQWPLEDLKEILDK